MVLPKQENTAGIQSLLVDKEWLRQRVAERNAKMGIVHNPHATAEESRRLIMECGVRPEDNLFSCGIIAARDEE